MRKFGKLGLEEATTLREFFIWKPKSLKCWSKICCTFWPRESTKFRLSWNWTSCIETKFGNCSRTLCLSLYKTQSKNFWRIATLIKFCFFVFTMFLSKTSSVILWSKYCQYMTRKCSLLSTFKELVSTPSTKTLSKTTWAVKWRTSTLKFQKWKACLKILIPPRFITEE